MRWSIIGLGNCFRQDDGAGRRVVQQLQHLHPEWPIQEVSGDSSGLMECLEDLDLAILVDAVSSGALPGTLHRLNASNQALLSTLRSPSSHTLGLAAAIELARALGQLPPTVWIYGIEGADFGYGDALSPAVEAQIPSLLEMLQREIASLTLTD